MLENINSAKDLKNLNYEQLNALAAEIREYILSVTSKNGGHVASNLGAVELSIALNRVYDAEKDRIIFDVGHQCYTHKIINGRRESFVTLRQFEGVSGFPKPYESEADAFIAGHSSNAASVALGVARARSISGADYEVCAVMGDGSLTGGLAWEGLENAAASREPMVIVLNDNKMSISRNVGGTSSMLSRMRVDPGYYDLKKRYRELLGIDSELYRFNHKLKENLKNLILPANVFSEMGLEYLGPVDGHDIRALESALKMAKGKRRPTLLHVITTKGKGYGPAEQNPEKFHGIGPFDLKTGEAKLSKPGFSDVMGQYLCSLAEKDERIVAVTAAMADGTGLAPFRERFPKRFFDTGITEGCAAAMCAGMAKQGLVPVFAVYSSFLQRAYDMLIHDVSLQQLHVVFCVDRTGLVGNDGETHHGVFDNAYLSSVPGIAILCPASFAELKDMLRVAIYDYSGPVAVRYPRGAEGEYRDSVLETEKVMKPGKDITVVACGTMINNALAACRQLEAEGISPELIKIGAISPCSFAVTTESLKKTGRLLIAEESCASGSVGERILSAAAEAGLPGFKAKLLNLGDGIVPQGTVGQLMKLKGLDAESMAAAVRELI